MDIHIRYGATVHSHSISRFFAIWSQTLMTSKRDTTQFDHPHRVLDTWRDVLKVLAVTCSLFLFNDIFNGTCQCTVETCVLCRHLSIARRMSHVDVHVISMDVSLSRVVTCRTWKRRDSRYGPTPKPLSMAVTLSRVSLPAWRRRQPPRKDSYCRRLSHPSHASLGARTAVAHASWNFSAFRFMSI